MGSSLQNLESSRARLNIDQYSVCDTSVEAVMEIVAQADDGRVVSAVLNPRPRSQSQGGVDTRAVPTHWVNQVSVSH
jgi:hypothetical protein